MERGFEGKEGREARHTTRTGPSNGPGCHELDVAPAYGGQPFGLATLAGGGIVWCVRLWRRCQAGRGGVTDGGGRGGKRHREGKREHEHGYGDLDWTRPWGEGWDASQLVVGRRKVGKG